MSSSETRPVDFAQARINRIADAIDNLAEQIKTTNNHVERLNREVGGLRGEVGGLRGEVGGVRADLNALRTGRRQVRPSRPGTARHPERGDPSSQPDHQRQPASFARDDASGRHRTPARGRTARRPIPIGPGPERKFSLPACLPPAPHATAAAHAHLIPASTRYPPTAKAPSRTSRSAA